MREQARRWRVVALLAAGITVGIAISASPATSHVASWTHNWTAHIRPKADARYVQKQVARSRYVPVAFGTGDTAVTDSLQILGPDEIHGISVLNDSDVDQLNEIIIGNDGAADLLVLAPGGPYTIGPGDGVEISGSDPLSLQAVISPEGQTPAWSVYLWCAFNPTLADTPAQVRCITMNATDSLFG